jgi:hypothetical protein
MPSLEPTAPTRRKAAAEPDLIAQQIQARLAELQQSELNPEDRRAGPRHPEATEITAGRSASIRASRCSSPLNALSDQGQEPATSAAATAAPGTCRCRASPTAASNFIENAAQNRAVPVHRRADKMRTVLACLCLRLRAGGFILIASGRKPSADHEVVRPSSRAASSPRSSRLRAPGHGRPNLPPPPPCPPTATGAVATRPAPWSPTMRPAAPSPRTCSASATT